MMNLKIFLFYKRASPLQFMSAITVYHRIITSGRYITHINNLREITT